MVHGVIQMNFFINVGPNENKQDESTPTSIPIVKKAYWITFKKPSTFFSYSPIHNRLFKFLWTTHNPLSIWTLFPI